jgi:hypothetical protein
MANIAMAAENQLKVFTGIYPGELRIHAFSTSVKTLKLIFMITA